MRPIAVCERFAVSSVAFVVCSAAFVAASNWDLKSWTFARRVTVMLRLPATNAPYEIGEDTALRSAVAITMLMVSAARRAVLAVTSRVSSDSSRPPWGTSGTAPRSTHLWVRCVVPDLHARMFMQRQVNSERHGTRRPPPRGNGYKGVRQDS